uniref:Uncharacterized protein n=1 Tax=Cacopsylla melanoneura TaxID=428564 RepID=A0A8D8WJH9_9HEMI
MLFESSDSFKIALTHWFIDKTKVHIYRGSLLTEESIIVREKELKITRQHLLLFVPADVHKRLISQIHVRVVHMSAMIINISNKSFNSPKAHRHQLNTRILKITSKVHRPDLKREKNARKIIYLYIMFTKHNTCHTELFPKHMSHITTHQRQENT